MYPLPFSAQYHTANDDELAQAAKAGSRQALDALLRRHQAFVYNVAFKMVLSPYDAEEITQEVLIKAFTRLHSFEGRSSFRTWLYRIVFNHVLNMKRYWLEEYITHFDKYGEDLDSLADHEMSETEKQANEELITESKLACMNGMLLCLSRQQRLVYILAELFGIDSKTGGEVLGLSADNYRQILARARRDLRQFMQKKCGLVDSQNPCRCASKTRAFVAAGWVDPTSMKFNTAYVHSIQALVPHKSRELDDLLATPYATVLQDQPYQDKDLATSLLAHPAFGDPLGT